MAAFTAFANTFNLGTDSIANTSALLSSLGIASDFTQYNKEVVFEGLKKLYRKKVLPLEVASKYTHFGHSAMNPSDLDAKPIVLVLGQVCSSNICMFVCMYACVRAHVLVCIYL
jgi:hypothetical protein